uniref:NADH-ubiquinone oxidoreductase chain 4L n=1 Tax=Quedenfeldtia trachyblepharus TaxID=460631 RepID=A0A343J8K3_9SAUR|nr:NADH dehydrogenase subunit 4L [Quedenfeldtia trachyblepharus]ASW34663.1 NADH dehydrogenase subunit 4L [Quedenfeldtia trachyblepharus]
MMPVHLLTATLFTLALVGLMICRKHLISTLLCIEGLMVGLFMALSLSAQTQQLPTTSTQPIILLALSACEAGTGLAMLVATSRTHTPTHLQALNLLKC